MTARQPDPEDAVRASGVLASAALEAGDAVLGSELRADGPGPTDGLRPFLEGEIANAAST